MLAVVAALGSALLVALASVLQHRAGHSSPDARLHRIISRPIWVAGAVVGVAGFALHVLALSRGSLSLVQPLLVSGLLFALPMSRALERRAIEAIEVIAAAAVVLGLAVFLLTAQPGQGHSVANPAVLFWCVVSTAAAAAVGLAGAALRPDQRAAWLGFCAGAAYGLVAALLKSSVDVYTAGGAAVLSTWTTYAFVVTVAGAIAVNQLAFNAGPLASSLPLITIVDPVVSVVIGALAFGETTSVGPGLVLGQLLGFATMSYGVLVLSRRASR